MQKKQVLTGRNVVQRITPTLVAGMIIGGLFASAAPAEPISIVNRENPNRISAFTLDFGAELGGIASGFISRTDYEIEVDADLGSARFTSYRQEVDPLILPGGFSTGHLLIEIVPDSSVGTYDQLTGVFVTNELYAIHFEGDLSAFGLESPVILPSSSAGVLQVNARGNSEINLNWIGEGELANPFDPRDILTFSYTCATNTLFSVDAPMFVRLSMIPQVLNLELQQDMETELLNKLHSTVDYLNAGRTFPAIGTLYEFIRFVDAEAGSLIFLEDADSLILAAEGALQLIGAGVDRRIDMRRFSR